MRLVAEKMISQEAADQQHQVRWYDALAFVYHLALILGLSLLIFRHHSGRLFIGNDGPTLISLASEQLTFFGISPDLYTNVYEGIGNLSLSVNLSILPQYWFAILHGDGIPTPAITYSLFAAQWFVTVLLVGWHYGFSPPVRYAGAWLLTLLFFPYFDAFKIYSLTQITPHIVTLILAGVLIDIAFRCIDGHSWRHAVYYTLFLLAGVVLVLITNPVPVMLVVPFLCLSILFSFLCSGSRREVVQKVMSAAAVLIFVGLAGWIEYSLGLTFYTAAGFFLSELAPTYPPSLLYVSILFQGYQELAAGAGPGMGLWLFIGGFAGAVTAVFTKNTPLRAVAIMLLIAQFVIILCGVAFVRLDGWTGPAPIYCEMPFFIFYALFATYFILRIIAAITTLVQYRLGLLCSPFMQAMLPLALVIALTVQGLSAPAQQSRQGSYALPPTASPITRILEREIALRPPALFAGRVATIMPGMGFNDQLGFFGGLNNSIGNDHQTTGLWLKGIPTLLEYNQMITPAFYRIVRDFLTTPEDKQNRSWTNFSKIDLPMLRLLGVRFLMTTERSIEDAKERAALHVPLQKTLRLFEIAGANIAGIAAGGIVTADTLGKAEEMMKSPAFDSHTAIVIGTPVPVATLVPAEESQLFIEKGGFHLRSTSSGLTMLILPIEFSKCLYIEALSGEKPRVMRVDIALTGVLFDRHTDVRLVNRIGLFTHPRCRWQDYKEFKAIVRGAAS